MTNEQEILTKAYEAFNRRDINAVLDLLQPDVDWANGMDGGRVSGREAVRDLDENIVFDGTVEHDVFV